ncbi:MAG: type II secretion system protein [Bryobacteraceae bacterium]|jgi:general secretion pathway protein I
MRRRGFTLLEMLVATAIMGIAVVGLMANLSASLRNASRLTDYDRAALLAHEKMDELLLDPRLPNLGVIRGVFDPAAAGNTEAGWSARLTPFEVPPNAPPGSEILERLELQVWWGPEGRRRTLALEGYRVGMLPVAEAQP